MKIERIELGNSVICDLCGDDFTNSDEQGGLVFGSKAVCPHCEQRILEGAKKYNEERFIGDRCPKGMSFKDFVINILRKGEPGYIQITSF